MSTARKKPSNQRTMSDDCCAARFALSADGKPAHSTIASNRSMNGGIEVCQRISVVRQTPTLPSPERLLDDIVRPDFT
jgi:hypothetical protein